jgi:DeoR/GlpR family transcriptional regulator of sugar metabolism
MISCVPALNHAHSCPFSPPNDSNRFSSELAARAGCWRRRSPRFSPPRRTRFAATSAISPGADFAGGFTAARCRSRRLQVRVGEATDRKAALGRALAALVAPGSFIFIDSGSTNLAAAKAFPEGLQATAATHDPAIAAVLSAKSEVTVWLIGGRVSPQIGAALGGRALADIEALRPDLALLGVCALDPVEGIAAFDPEDAEIKRAILRNSRRIAAALLNEKLETSAPFAVGRAEGLDCVVLEADAPEAVARGFAKCGIDVRRAQPAQTR